MVRAGSSIEEEAASSGKPRATGELQGEEPEELTPAAGGWRRLVRRLRRVRHRQRIFGYLGQALQRYPAWLRDRLRRVDPTASQARR